MSLPETRLKHLISMSNVQPIRANKVIVYHKLPVPRKWVNEKI